MGALGDTLTVALEEQGWTLLEAEYDMVMVISPGFRTFTLDHVILEEAEFEPFLLAQIELMEEEGGLIWPWPPR